MAVLHLLLVAALEGFRVATVKCDVCGGTFSQRHLASHKRLAHTKMGQAAAAAPSGPISENELFERIASLCKGLSVQGRKRAIRLLSQKSKEDREKESQ